MDKLAKEFLTYLEIEKNAAAATIFDYGLELKKFSRFLKSQGTKNAEEITLSTLRAYLKHIKETRKLKPVSIAKKIAILKSFFNFLEISEYITTNPARRIQTPKKQRKLPIYLTADEIKKLLETTGNGERSRFVGERERNRALLYTLAYTGIRRSELLSLNWEDIDLKNYQMRIRDGKGGKDRLIPLHPSLVRVIREYQIVPSIEATGPFLKGRYGKRMHMGVFKRIFRRYLAASGIEKKVTPHSLRHSCASLLLKTGANLVEIQDLLGHQDISTTRLYLQLNPESLNEAIERLPIF